MGQMGAAQTNQQAMTNLGSNIGNALAGLGGAFGDVVKSNRDAKSMFEGSYEFLSGRNMLPPDINAAIMERANKKDYAGANSMIAPLLAELEFGRKAMLSGRSGFFDSQGSWQMAMPAQSVEPRNKYGFKVE